MYKGYYANYDNYDKCDYKDSMAKVVALALPRRQVILGAITGEGGILFYISKGITEGVLGDVTDVTFTSPTKFIVSPLTAPWFRFTQRLAK